MIRLYNGDCLKAMDRLIADGVKVDLVLTDPPYGTTSCKWDSIIPLDEMWDRINKLVKNDNTAIVFFGSEPFSSILISSNLKAFKYKWIWDKGIPSGFGFAKYMPMRQTEDIVVFTKKGKKTAYYPQMMKRDKPIKSGGNKKTTIYSGFKEMGNKEYKKTYDYKYPVTLIRYPKIKKGSFHPTQKPVELLEYLIKTYSNEGDLVLDFTMGSGSTGVACKNLNRNFIGIELDKKYFEIAKERVGV